MGSLRGDGLAGGVSDFIKGIASLHYGTSSQSLLHLRWFDALAGGAYATAMLAQGAKPHFALPGGALILAKVIFFTLWGVTPNPLCPPGGPHFCQQKWGKDCQRGKSPLGTPTGKQTAACDCAGPKDRPACATALWLSLIKCLRRICMWSLSLPLSDGCGWHTNTRKAKPLWASPWSAL